VPSAVEADGTLVISGASLVRFAEQGWLCPWRQAGEAGGVDRRLPAAGRTARIFWPRSEAIERDGEAEVFDVEVPGINAFDANRSGRAQLRRAALPPYGRLPARLDQTWRNW